MRTSAVIPMCSASLTVLPKSGRMTSPTASSSANPAKPALRSGTMRTSRISSGQSCVGAAARAVPAAWSASGRVSSVAPDGIARTSALRSKRHTVLPPSVSSPVSTWTTPRSPELAFLLPMTRL